MNMRSNLNRVVVVSVLLALGCREQKTTGVAEGTGTSPEAAVGPPDAIVLLKDKKPEEQPFCLDATGSDGKRVTVGRLSPTQAEHEAGRFYVGVFNEGTEITGDRRLTLKRTFFTDPAAAVKAATELGVNQFRECPKFAPM
jgi:hypothetical protein